MLDIPVPCYPFEIGEPYTRADVFNVIGLEPAPTGGSWFTGYTSHGPDWFIFCGVGTGGRTGHDYGNHFDGDRLIWYGKTKSSPGQPSIQKLVGAAGQVYIFFRAEDRAPFTFAGLGSPLEVIDQTPVKIIWTLRGVNGARPPTTIPEEIDTEAVQTVFEGARRVVEVNVYERDPSARRSCIARWGAVCAVCGFDFGKRYGPLGRGFIHVHHLKPLGEVCEGYELNPIEDLRPVCPNCHAMLHRRKPAIGIDDLRRMLKPGSGV